MTGRPFDDFTPFLFFFLVSFTFYSRHVISITNHRCVTPINTSTPPSRNHTMIPWKDFYLYFPPALRCIALHYPRHLMFWMYLSFSPDNPCHCWSGIIMVWMVQKSFGEAPVHRVMDLIREGTWDWLPDDRESESARGPQKSMRPSQDWGATTFSKAVGFAIWRMGLLHAWYIPNVYVQEEWHIR